MLPKLTVSVLLLVRVQGGRVNVPLTLIVTLSVTAEADVQAKAAISAAASDKGNFMGRVLCVFSGK